MAGNDISSLIQDIYRKYNESQKNKKIEERIYMTEDAFRANLEDMVKKSFIEDKKMLYNEIYRRISENALEIDSSGNVVISPKLIFTIEEDIKIKAEQDELMKKSNKLKNDENITHVMTKEMFDKLPSDERRKIVVDGVSVLFDGDIKKSEDFVSAVNSTDLSQVDGASISAERLRQNDYILTSEDEGYVYNKYGNKEYNSNGTSAVILVDEALEELKNNPIWQLIAPQNPDENIEDSYYFTVLAQKIIKQESFSEEDLQDLFRDDPKRLEILSKMDGKFDINMLKSFMTTFYDVLAFRNMAILEENASTVNSFDIDTLKKMGLFNEQLKKGGVPYFQISKDNVKSTNTVYADLIQKFDRNIPIQNLAQEQINHDVVELGTKGENVRTGVKGKQILPDMTADMDRVKGMISDFYKRENTRYHGLDNFVPQFVDTSIAKRRYEDLVTETKGKKDEELISDGTEIEDKKDFTAEMEADFESSLASISDMEPDMFADMFSDMAEEIVFEETTFETEKVVQEDETHEVAGDDRTAQGQKETQILEEVGTEELTEKEVKGIQVEDINVDETLTNTMNNENLPKKITWVDKVRASVDAFGKNVKKAFGSFISAITGKGGENNSGANNSTSSTSSNAGQNKPVQEVNNFVPTVELNLKQAQQATKAAEEAKKNNDARGTDEPTQDDSEIGE